MPGQSFGVDFMLPDDQAAEYIQRLLAGCPVKEPDPADFNGQGEAVRALWETREKSQEHGLRAARNAFDAMCRAEPRLKDIVPRDSYYSDALDLEEATLSKLREYEYTEAGQGEAFSYLFADRLRYIPGVGWVIWTGTRWQPDSREAIIQYAVMAARARRAAVQAEPPPQGDSDEVQDALRKREQALKWTMGAENYSKIRNSIGMGKTVPGMITPHYEFDRDKHLLGVQNGIVNLRTGQLMEPDPDRYITMSTNVPYFPDAQAPRWERFISEIFGGDEELAAYIQRAIGYSLTGDISEQCFFLCYGTGANGKSTLLNTLKALAGEYAANTPFQTFEHKQQSSTGQEIVALRGKRVVMSSETNEGTRLNEARIKAITGGDEITGRFLYERATITFTPTFKIWLAANHKPTITGGDEGIWRRVRLVPFMVSFPKDKRDPHLEDTLMAELPGVLAWAVRGAMAWHQQGLGEPLIVEEATREYRDESDVLGQFLHECAIEQQGATAKSSLLYEAYQKWMGENGFYALSSVRFARSMKERGYEKKHTMTGNVWLDLGLLHHED